MAAARRHYRGAKGLACGAPRYWWTVWTVLRADVTCPACLAWIEERGGGL